MSFYPNWSQKADSKWERSEIPQNLKTLPFLDYFKELGNLKKKEDFETPQFLSNFASPT